ncbi:MAG TPA: hypothetical protein VF587_13200 [Solirubrobacteraceae bacterium]
MPLWKRFRRRSMAPRRPAVFEEQWPLVVVTLVVLLGSVGIVVWALLST